MGVCSRHPISLQLNIEAQINSAMAEVGCEKLEGCTDTVDKLSRLSVDQLR